MAIYFEFSKETLEDLFKSLISGVSRGFEFCTSLLDLHKNLSARFITKVCMSCYLMWPMMKKRYIEKTKVVNYTTIQIPLMCWVPNLIPKPKSTHWCNIQYFKQQIISISERRLLSATTESFYQLLDQWTSYRLRHFVFDFQCLLMTQIKQNYIHLFKLLLFFSFMN